MQKKKLQKPSVRNFLISSLFLFAFFIFSQTTYAFSISDLINGFKNYVSPVVVPVVVKKTTTTPNVIKVVSSNSGITQANLNAEILKLLNSPDIQAKFKGAKGDSGINGVTTTVFSSAPSSPNPVGYLPVGVTIPNATYNFSGGAYENIANLSSNIFTTNTANVTDITVSGSSTLKGDLSVGGNLSVTGNLNPNLTNGSVLFQGASGITQDNANLFYNPTTHRLGIGTTTPASALAVNGNISLNYGTLDFGGQAGDHSYQIAVGVNVMNYDAYGAHVFRTGLDGAETTVMSVGTNVGIGTSNPLAKLDVSSSAGGANSGIRLIQAAENITAQLSYVPIDFTVPTTGLMGQFLATANNYSNASVNLPNNSVGLLAEATSGSLSFISGGSSGDIRMTTGGYAVANERMRILSGGNIGIGLTNPTGRLIVKSAGTTTGIGFQTQNSSGTALLTTLDNGNVGIGTTLPGQKLEIGTTADTGAQYFHLLTSTNDVYLGQSAGTLFGFTTGQTGVLAQNGSVPLSIGTIPAQPLVFGTTNTERMRISSGGNVGIGTTVPGYPLDVVGTSSTVRVGSSAQKRMALIGGSAGSVYEYDSAGYFAVLSAANANVGGGNGVAQFKIEGGAPANSLYINSGGNVGIGTTTPGQFLDIVGGIGLNSGGISVRHSNLTQGVSIGYQGISKVGTTANTDITLDATGTGNILMHTNSTGNVGIGMTGPTSKLDVIGSVGPSSGGITVKHSNLTEGVSIGYQGISKVGTTANTNLFLNATGTGNVILQNTATGNVGIGTVSPGAYLDINPTYTGASTTTLYNDRSGFTLNNGAATITNYYGKYISAPTLTAGAITNTYALVTEAGAGNVGIGVVNPNSQLKVQFNNPANGDKNNAVFQQTITSGQTINPSGGQSFNVVGSVNVLTGAGSSGNFDGIIQTTNQVNSGTSYNYVSSNSLFSGGTTTSISNFIGFYSYGGNGGTTAVTNQYDFRASNFNNPAGMTITNRYGLYIDYTNANVTNAYGVYQSSNTLTNYFAGNVGIGTTSPTAPLEVKGTGTGATIAKFTDVNTTGCTIATGGTISCSSDIRLKKNITDISYGLDTLMHLRPVTYNWNYQDDTNTPNLGFIAQEVQSIIPNLVTTDSSTGYEQLNTIGLVPVLTKSIQEVNLNLESISNTITLSSGQTLSATQQSFYDSFFSNVKKVMTGWLADAGNGIGDLFAHKATLDEVCLKDINGTSCYTRAQLDKILSGANNNVLPPASTPPPAIGSTDPAIGSTDPAIGNTQPAVGSTDPGIGTTIPDIGNTQPVVGSTDPTN